MSSNKFLISQFAFIILLGAGCSFEKVDGSFEKVDGSFEKVDGSFEKVDSSYYTINVEKKSKVPTKYNTISDFLVRVDRYESRVEVHSLENESKRNTKTYFIEENSLIGNWTTVEDYTIRLLFPDLQMKYEKPEPSITSPLRGLIFENRKDGNWEIYKRVNSGPESSLKGTVIITKDSILFNSGSNMLSADQGYWRSSTIVIKAMQGFETVKFDLLWDSNYKN